MYYSSFHQAQESREEQVFHIFFEIIISIHCNKTINIFVSKYKCKGLKSHRNDSIWRHSNQFKPFDLDFQLILFKSISIKWHLIYSKHFEEYQYCSKYFDSDDTTFKSVWLYSIQRLHSSFKYLNIPFRLNIPRKMGKTSLKSKHWSYFRWVPFEMPNLL